MLQHRINSCFWISATNNKRYFLDHAMKNISSSSNELVGPNRKGVDVSISKKLLCSLPTLGVVEVPINSGTSGNTMQNCMTKNLPNFVMIVHITKRDLFSILLIKAAVSYCGAVRAENIGLTSPSLKIRFPHRHILHHLVHPRCLAHSRHLHYHLHHHFEHRHLLPFLPQPSH